MRNLLLAGALSLASVVAFAPPNDAGTGAPPDADAVALAAKRTEYDTLTAKPSRSAAQTARMNELKVDLDAADKAAADAQTAADKAAFDKAASDRLATAGQAPPAVATTIPRNSEEMPFVPRVADPSSPALVQAASVSAGANGTEIRTGDGVAVPGLPDLIAPTARGGEVKLPDPAITATLDSGFHPNPPTLPENAGLSTSADPDAARKAAERAEERRAGRDPALAEQRAQAQQDRVARNSEIKDKRCIFMLSREYAPASVPDIVMQRLTDIKAVPQDGFAVRSVPADDETGVPSHLRISFDPGPGWIDRDLLEAMLRKPVAEALAV